MRAAEQLSPSPTPELVAALTVAGSDSGAAAGAQADLLTFAACGVYGTTAITALTAQNPTGIAHVQAASPESVRAQMEQVAAYYPLRAMKTGMLVNAGIVQVVADFAAAHPRLPLVVDPVLVATSGLRLLDETALRLLTELLLPRATLVTPNLDEAAVLLGVRPAPHLEALREAAAALAGKFGVPVLLKGGHAGMDPVVDILAGTEGPRRHWESPRAALDMHGGGCALAAAITAFLARGADLAEAIALGHAALQRAVASPLSLGGRRFLNHGAMVKRD